MKIVTCASYYGTGSSAIVDYVSEYSNVFSCTNMELRFIEDPDGIAELEYNLVDNFNRHNSGHSLKRYRRLVDFYSGNLLGKKLSSIFGNYWKKRSYQYIEELTDFSFPGWWMYDLYDKGPNYYFRKRILNKLLSITFWRNRPDRVLNTMKGEMTLCSHPTEEEFVAKTQNYIHDLLISVLPEDRDTIVVDQLLAPTNISKHLKYFKDDIKVIIVDRDPRDIYILEKYVWKSGMIPSDVVLFCKWFMYTRSHRDSDNLQTPNIRFIQFEDMIYKYEITTHELAEWVGLNEDKHFGKFMNFNPSKSKNNTRMWEKISVPRKELEYIENKLGDYLYDYTSVNSELR